MKKVLVALVLSTALLAVACSKSNSETKNSNTTGILYVQGEAVSQSGDVVPTTVVVVR